MSNFERNFGLSSRARFHTIRDTQMAAQLPNHLPTRRERSGIGLNYTEIPVSKEDRERLSRHIISTYAGIDNYLKQNSDDKEFIVDMWLVSKPPDVEPIPPEAVVKKLRSLSRKIDQFGLHRLPQEWGWARVNLEATATYLEEKSRTNGQKMSYEDYLAKVSGFKPRLIPKDELEAGREEILELLSRLGLKFDPNNYASIKVALEAYTLMNRTPSRGMVENSFRRFDMRFRHQVARILDADLSAITFDFRWKEEDAFWKFWERVEPDGYHLDANWHTRQRKNWTWGTTEIMAVHELAHFEMAYLLSEEINAGRLDSVAGVFIIPGPGCYVLEGVAQTMPELAGLDLADDGRLSIALYRSWVRTRTNGLYKLEMGYDFREVVEESRRFAPDKTLLQIEADYQDGLSKPFERAYLPIYGLSDYDFSMAKRELGEAMDIVLKECFRRPMLRDDLVRPTLDIESLLGYEPPPSPEKP